MVSPPDQLDAAGDGRAELQQLAKELGFHSVWELSGRDLGTPITDSRSSWVRRIDIGIKQYYAKTYDYPTWRDRLRGSLRNTGPTCTSRAAREAAALRWFADAGMAAPRACGFLEDRRLGWVARCLIVTERFPGRDLATVLTSASSAERREIGTALGAFVAKMHQRGFRDRNLDLRNLLLAEDRTHLVIAKIDSPRHRLVPEGAMEDALVRADWERLTPQLRAFGIAEVALAAAGRLT